MKHAYFYETAIGRVGIAEADGAVTNVFFGNTVVPADYTELETPLLHQAGLQLAEYLDGKRLDFDLPLSPEGTEFERRVWQALRAIPYGETRTYGQLAASIGKPSASRAVGRANSRNPLSIFIPCHRVIGAGGKLVGYAGGLDLKTRLLKLEGAL